MIVIPERSRFLVVVIVVTAAGTGRESIEGQPVARRFGIAAMEVHSSRKFVLSDSTTPSRLVSIAFASGWRPSELMAFT